MRTRAKWQIQLLYPPKDISLETQITRNIPSKESYCISKHQWIKYECSDSEEAAEVLLYEGEDESHKNKSCEGEGQEYPHGQQKD